MRTILIIPNLKYEHNLYNAIRSGEAFGITEVWIPYGKKLSKIFPQGARKAYKHIKINRFKTDEEVANYLVKEKIKPICIENSKDSVSILNFNFPADIALIMGHENLGVSPFYTLKYKSVRIPQFGVMNCLNTYVAMSIIMYERFKQGLKV